jgi:Cu(I)/Ag(I) efflux system membrane protein CusA/SilA
MLATGIKSPVGIKVAGPDLAQIDAVAAAVARYVANVPGVTSAFADRLTGGRYIDIDVKRDAAARYGMNVADVHSVVATAIGGENVGETVEGLARFPINVRYPREIRDSLPELEQLPIVTERGAQIVLADVAQVQIVDGPPMLKTENARLSGWVYVDVRGRDLRSAVVDMQAAVAQNVMLPPGYSISWSGQFEYLERAAAQLRIAVPVTLAIIFVLLYLTFRRYDEALLWSGASGCCTSSGTTFRSRARSASLRSPASRPSSALSCCCSCATHGTRPSRADAAVQRICSTPFAVVRCCACGRRQ